MAKGIRKVDYYVLHTNDQPGEGAHLLKTLKKHKVKMEDPGNEIGPESPGSPHMGLWFHDPDGYRWELSVQGGK